MDNSEKRVCLQRYYYPVRFGFEKFIKYFKLIESLPNQFKDDNCRMYGTGHFCQLKFCEFHTPEKYVPYILLDERGNTLLTLVHRCDGMNYIYDGNEMLAQYLLYGDLWSKKRNPTYEVLLLYFRKVFAAKKIQKYAILWLGKPSYANGKTGFFARKGWEAYQKDISRWIEVNKPIKLEEEWLQREEQHQL